MRAGANCVGSGDLDQSGGEAEAGSKSVFKAQLLEIRRVAQDEPGGGRRRRVPTGVPTDLGLRDC